MRIFGVEQFDDAAVTRFHVSMPETISCKFKKKLITQLERNENHYNRWTGCKFNDRGKQHKKGHSNNNCNTQMMRQRGAKKAADKVLPAEEYKWHLAHFSRHEPEAEGIRKAMSPSTGGSIVHHFR